LPPPSISSSADLFLTFPGDLDNSGTEAEFSPE